MKINLKPLTLIALAAIMFSSCASLQKMKKNANLINFKTTPEILETNAGKVKVQFYRRPLCQIISPIIDEGFIIEKLIEPMPTEKFKELHPKVYEGLTRKPQFLFLRARKTEN